MSDLAAALAAVRDAVDGLEPGVISVEMCRTLIEELARTEKVCALARVRVAERIAGSVNRQGSAASDVAELLARASGASAASAKSDVTTVRALAGLPTLRGAVEVGELSLAQAHEIAKAVKVAPSEEGRLVDHARRTGVAALSDECRRVRLAAIDVDELHDAQRRRREAVTFTNEWGMVCLRAQFPPEVGVAIANRLGRATDRCWRAARRAAGPGKLLEPRAAYAADALVAMLGGRSADVNGTDCADRPAKSVRREVDVVIVADVRALERGQAAAGEPCHVVGGGPVPASVVRSALEDAFVKLVTHDGVRIREVVHVGRKLPAVLRTALELGEPPRFDGVSCAEDGCGRRLGLEWDHVDPVANGGVTSLKNLEPRCRPCHRAKTERDRAAGLLRAKGPP
jgi:hypothetical protein